jgi:hypothetical protein
MRRYCLDARYFSHVLHLKYLAIDGYKYTDNASSMFARIAIVLGKIVIFKKTIQLFDPAKLNLEKTKKETNNYSLSWYSICDFGCNNDCAS